MKDAIVRRVARVAAGIAGALALGIAVGAAPVEAQTFPSKAIQITAPFPPGGSADFFARAVSTRLSHLVGQPVVIENKPGAGGVVGTRAVIASPPDGYSLLATSTGSLVVAPNLSNPPAFDPLKDVAPITAIGKPFRNSTMSG